VKAGVSGAGFHPFLLIFNEIVIATDEGGKQSPAVLQRKK
jgi:hypothetical protein